MTAPLTIKDLNCGNCTNDECEYHELNNDCKAYNVKTGKIRAETLQAQKITAKAGCALHPLALQALAAPTIEELEKEEKEQIGIYQNATTMNEEVYHQGIVFGIQRAAKLLKEGVKKP